MSLVPKVWDLRWRFDFKTRPTRQGLWTNPGPVGNQAWHQNKEGLAFAIIEGKHTRTKELKSLVVCEGHRFRNFQWIAANRHARVTEVVGMSLWMDSKRVEVFIDGRVKVSELSEDEKKINLATYGR